MALALADRLNQVTKKDGGKTTTPTSGTTTTSFKPSSDRKVGSEISVDTTKSPSRIGGVVAKGLETKQNAQKSLATQNTKQNQQTTGTAPKAKSLAEKANDFLTKYFTDEGIESLPDDSKYKQFAQKLGGNFSNDGSIGSSFITTDSQIKEQGDRADKRISVEKLLSGQESKNYTMSPEEINSFGVVLDKRTGQKADDTYVNALYENLGTKSGELTAAYTKLNDDYQNGLIDSNEYTKQYRELEKQREAFNKDVTESENFQYVGGMDYYNWLKENGTQDEVESFEDYVSSYDDTMLESLANSYKATIVDWVNSNVEPIESVVALMKGDDNYLTSDERISTQFRNISQELQSYTTNGKNDQGLRNYTLQTISSLFPMINDTIIATITGDALGLSAKGIKMFASAYTSIQIGMSEAGNITRQRLDEGNTIGTSFSNGVAHGTIEALVELLNVGNVSNVVGLLTGTAGMGVLGVGLLSLPKLSVMLTEAAQDGFGEAFEEWAGTAAGFYADRMQNWLSGKFGSGETVKVGDSPWAKETYGAIGEGGLTDQMIMAGAGAVLLGLPTNTSVLIDSAEKYKAGGEAIKFWESMKEYAASVNDADSIAKAQANIDFLNQQRQTYMSESAVKDAVELSTDQVSPAPSIDDVMNVTANAFKLDVANTIDNYEQMKASAENMENTLRDAMERRGVDAPLEKFVGWTAEQRKNVLEGTDYANSLNVRVGYNDNFEGDGYYDPETKKIMINPNSKLGEVSTMIHELTHFNENSRFYQDIKKLVEEDYKGDIKAAEKNIINEYAKHGVDLRKGNLANREFVAIEAQAQLGNVDFVKKLIRYNQSLAYRMFKNIQAMTTSDVKTQLENTFMQAFRDAQTNGYSAEPGVMYSQGYSPSSEPVDNEGRTLTKGQQKYFKGSKLTDALGRLLRLFHTSSASFDEFNPVGTDNYRFGDKTVIYVSTDSTVSGSYTGDNFEQVTNDEYYKERDKKLEEIEKLRKEAADAVENQRRITDDIESQMKTAVDNSGAVEIAAEIANSIENNEELFKGSKTDYASVLMPGEDIAEEAKHEVSSALNGVINGGGFAKARSLLDLVKMLNGSKTPIFDISLPESVRDALSSLKNVDTAKAKELMDLYKSETERLASISDETGKAYEKASDDLGTYDLNTGKQYVGYGKALNPYILELEDGLAQANWNEINDMKHGMESSSFNSALDEITEAFSKVSPEEVLQTRTKNKVTRWILDNVSGETKKTLMENPIVLANLAAKLKTQFGSAYVEAETLATMAEKQYGNAGYFEDAFKSTVEASAKHYKDLVKRFLTKEVDRNTVFSSSERLETNDVVRTVLVINDYTDNPYDAVVFRGITDSGSEMAMDIPSDIIALFDSNDFKLIGNENPTESKNIRHSFGVENDNTNLENVGYHYGRKNLNPKTKSERLYQRSGRGTGAFGTGLYVFGENGENRESYGKNLTEHEIDLSNYNMFKPQDSEEGYILHRLFKELDDNYSYEGPKTKEELKQTISDLVNELNEIEYNENGDAIVSPEFEAEIRERLMALEDDERYVDDLLDDNRTSEGGELLADYLADELVDRYIDEKAYGRKSPKSLDWVEDYEITMNHIPELAKILKEDETVVRNAVYEAIRTANEDRNKPDFWGGNYDSVGTRVMKQLGYEGIDVRGIKGLDNSTYGTVIYDLKPESLRGRTSNNSFASVAPFRKEDATPENWESLKERSKPFLENAKKIADDLGLKMVRTTPVFGAFKGDNELSYEIEIEGKNRDKVDLYAYILGDIGQEGQEGVLISDYVTGEEDANSMELSFMVKDVDAAAKVLNDLGVKGYSSPEGSNVINITQGTYEYEDSYEKLAQGVVELERRIREGLGDNYAGTEKSSSNSRYAEPDDRRRVYQERLAAYQEQQQNGNEDNREVARIKEALEALNKNFPEESAQEGAFLNSEDDLNISEKDLEGYQTRITPVTERKYNNDRNIDTETGVLKPKAIVELETTIGKTTHEAEIEDGQEYAGKVAQQLDAGTDPQDIIDNLKKNPLDNGLVRAYYTAQVLADRGLTSEYREVAQWARDIDNLGGKLVESTKILYTLEDSFSRAVYLEKVQQNLIDEYKVKYGKKSKVDIDQTINDIFQQYYDQIIESKTAREFSTALGALVRKANAAMPKTAWDRITQYRMWAMLSGTKTATGNLVSNLASLGLYRLNGINQALLESALKKVDIKRVDETKTYKIDQSQRNATFNRDSKTSQKNKALAKEVWKQIGEDVKSKYGEDVEKIPDIVKKNILTKNDNLKSPLRKAVDTTTDILQRIQNIMLNDAPVSRLAFIQKFDELAQVRGIDVDTIDKKSKAYNKLIDDAYAYAEEVVSHNATDISNTLSNIQKRSSTNVRVNEGSFLEGLDKTIKNIKQKSNEGQLAYRFLDNTMMTLQKWFVPFYKTNASIMQKSLQYSPLEWIQVANDFNKVKNGKMDLVDLVEHMSKAVTGSELYILGAVFAYLGWLKWDRDDEDYSGKLSIKIPGTDKGYTVDFIDPASTIFAKGVVLAQDFVESGLSFKTLHSLVNDYEDIFLSDELDMFSSMKDFFDTVGKAKEGKDDYGEYTLSDGATDMAFSILNSYIPAIIRDISRIADPAKKVVYDTNNAKYLFNRLLNSTPFRNKLVDKKDATGNTITYTQPFTKNDVFNRILTQMVSRGKLVDMEGNTVQGRTNESSLGEKAGEFTQMAKDFPYNDTNGDGFSDTHWIRESVPANIYPAGEQVELNPQERDEYGKTWTDTWTSGANALASNDVYKKLDYEKQADVVYELQAFARECIEADYCKNNGLEMTKAQKKADAIRNFCMTNGKLDGYILSMVALGTAKENKLASGGQQYVLGMKDKDGKTVKNSRQLYMRQMYEEAGIYDDVIEAIQNSKDLDYADFGLSKTVVEKYSKQEAKSKYNDIYKDVMSSASSDSSGSKKSSSSSKKSSSKKYSGGAGGITKAKGAGSFKKLSPGKIANDTKPNLNKYYSAYQNVFNRGSKKVSTGGNQTVVCPRCGSRVSSSNGRCPVCGNKL